MNAHAWLAVALGVVVIGIGLAMFVFRAAIARLNANGQRAYMGRIGKQTSQGSTPGIIGAVAVVAMLIGLLFLVLGVVAMFR